MIDVVHDVAVTWSLGPRQMAREPTRGASPASRDARGRTLHVPLHDTLRVPRALRRVDAVRVRQTPAPPLNTSTLGVDAVLRRMRARPALSLLGLCVCAALGAHGALALGSANLRPKRVHKERVAMSVAQAPVDEVLPEPTPPPPPPEPSVAAPRSSTTPASSAPAAAPTPGLPIAPSLTSPGGGFGPALAGGGGGGGSGEARGAHAAAARPQDQAVTPPRAHPRTPPRYPASARAQGLEGRVVLSVLVDARGRVADVKVLESDPAGVFDAAAVDAARRWTFQPATRGGAPSDAWVRQVVRFTLD
jgi:periplasmic protein TonB